MKDLIFKKVTPKSYDGKRLNRFDDEFGLMKLTPYPDKYVMRKFIIGLLVGLGIGLILGSVITVLILFV